MRTFLKESKYDIVINREEEININITATVNFVITINLEKIPWTKKECKTTFLNKAKNIERNFSSKEIATIKNHKISLFHDTKTFENSLIIKRFAKISVKIFSKLFN